MANRFWVGGTGTWDAVNTANWSATNGGAGGASVPIAADAVFFNVNSGSGVVTLGQDVDCLTCNLSGYTGTLDWANYRIKIAGNATTIFRSDVGVTVAGNPTIECTYAGSTGTRTFTMFAVSEADSINVLVSAGSDTVTNTTSNFKDLDFTGFSGTLIAIARTVFGNLTFDAGMTLGSGTGATTFGATSGTRTITTNGTTINFPLTFNGIGGTFAFQDALTQASNRQFTIINGTVKLKNGVTSTVGAFATSSTNQKFLSSTLTGSQATLSQAGGTVNAMNLTIQDINATGGATWNAYTTNNNVDAGNNLGWDFSFQIGRCIYTRRKNKRILP